MKTSAILAAALASLAVAVPLNVFDPSKVAGPGAPKPVN